MAIVFPTSLDALSNPASGALLSTGHAAQHADVNDAIEALETRVGITASADATSLTKRIAVLEAAGSGAPVTACEVVSSTVFNSFQRSQGWAQKALTSQRLMLSGFISPASFTAATVSVYVDGTGGTSTSTTIGLYTVSAADAGTLIATATGATTVFNTQGLKTISFASPVAITSGTRYAVGILQNGGAAAGPMGHPGSGDGTLKFLQPFICAARSGVTAQGNFLRSDLVTEFSYYWFQIST